MNKFIRLLILAMLSLSVLLPVSAQYDQDDIDHAQCVHIEIRTDSSGQFIHVFIYQDELNAILSGDQFFIPFDIQTTTPNTVLVFNIIVAPQNLLVIETPNAIAVALVLEDGQWDQFAFSFLGGSALIRPGNMDTECLGAATDGRINRFDQQMLAVIYHDGNGGYDIWAVDPATSQGTFDYNVSRAQVDAGLAASGSDWQVIGSGSTSTLYTGANGECVLTSPNAGGEMQTFVFDCAAIE